MGKKFISFKLNITKLIHAINDIVNIKEYGMKLVPSLKMAFVILTITFSLSTEHLYAWTKHLDFEEGITGTEGFSFIGSTVSQTKALSHSGSYSAQILFAAGDRCWDDQLTCGAGFNDFPTTVGIGTELWTRVYFYFPSDFDWGDNDRQGWRKILRYTIGSRGNISIGGFWGNSGNECEIIGNTEAGNHYTYYDQFSGINFPAGQWHSVEQYVKFGTTDETTRHMIWLNGDLIFDSINFVTNNPVLGSSSDILTRILFFSYWNGGVRISQNAYIDNIIITSETPAQRDAKGNPMIGPENGIILPKPNAVQNFRVE